MRRRNGFALIAALWFVVLLSGLALEFALTARDTRVSSMNAHDETMARAAALAGLAHARAVLHRALQAGASADHAAASVRTRMDPWRDLSRVLPDTLSIHQQQFAVELRDVGARLNVNHSSEAELRRLLVALRLDAALSDRLAQRIADWTDGDDLHRPRGAERDAYLKAGAPVLPTNRRLRDSGELRWILGITPVLHDRIAPFVTTVGSGRINLRTAPRPVLLALPGMTEEAVELIIRARREPWRPLDPDAIHKMLSTRARALMLPHLPELTARTVSATQEVEVRSTGWARDDRVRTQVTALVVRAGEDMLTSGRQLR